jgi:hypothetical protein
MEVWDIMNKRVLLVALGAVIFFAVAVMGWYLAAPLLFDTVVDEGFPFDVPGGRQAAVASANLPNGAGSGREDNSSRTLQSPSQVSNDKGASDETTIMASTVGEMPAKDGSISDSSGWLEIASGSFIGADSFHQGSGRVAVYENGDERVLRFEDFSVTNGPDLHLILTKHPAPSDRSDVGEDYLDLGSLKGNIGNQNYEIPDGFDLSVYKGVVIYCVPFHVVFATATLN